jgi:ribonuclease HI
MAGGRSGGATDNNGAASKDKVGKPTKKKTSKFYAVSAGDSTGIFTFWDGQGGCQESVKHYSGAKHQSFIAIIDAIDHLARNKFKPEDIVVYSDEGSLKLGEYCSNKKIDIDLSQFEATISKATMPTSVNPTVIYVDGACLDNGLDGACGGYGIYWGPNDVRNTSAPLPRDGHTHTNNRAEQYAAIMALKSAKSQNIKHVNIRSDSQYVVQGMTNFLVTWKANDSLKQKPNADLWSELDELCQDLTVMWEHVKGHADNAGNVAADELANKGAHSLISDNGASSELSSELNIVTRTNENTKPQEITASENGITISQPEEENNNKSRPCSLCCNKDEQQMLQCKLCRKWLHYCCTDLPRYQLYLLCSTTRIFQCAGCTTIPDNFRVIEHRESDKVKEDSAAEIGSNRCDQSSIAETTCDQILLKVLDISRKVDEVANVKNAVHDIEKMVLDKLVASRNDKQEIELATLQSDLKSARDDNGRINVRNRELCTKNEKLKSTTQDLQDKLSKSSGGKNVNGPTDPSSVSMNADLVTCQKRCNSLSQENAKLVSKVTEFEVKTITCSAQCKSLELENKCTEKLLLRCEKEIENKSSLIEQLEKDNRLSQEKINYLSDELVSWKLHCQQSDSNTSYTVIPGTPDPPRNQTPKPVKTANRFASLSQKDEDSKPDTSNDNVAHQMQEHSSCVDQVDSKPTRKALAVHKPSANCDVDSGGVSANQKETNNDSGTDFTDIIIIGNSQTKSIDPNKIYKNKSCLVKTLDANEKHISGAIKFVTNCKKTAASAVVLQVCSNSLADESVEVCMEKCKNLIAACKNKFPGAEICIAESLPRKIGKTETDEIYNARSQKFNRSVHTLGATIIHHSSLGDVNRRLYQRDGIHLTRDGLTHLIRNYKTVLNPILGLPDYNSYSSLKTEQGQDYHTERGYHTERRARHSNFPHRNNVNRYRNSGISVDEQNQRPEMNRNDLSVIAEFLRRLPSN